jgi:hypothetical protein
VPLGWEHFCWRLLQSVISRERVISGEVPAVVRHSGHGLEQDA